MALSAGSPAYAAQPVITYSGTLVVTSEGSPSESYPATVTVDCSSGTCVAQVSITDGTDTVLLTGPGGVVLVGGRASGTVADVGSGACENDYLPGGPVSIAADATSFSMERDGTGSGQIDCADGSTVQYDTYHAVLAATYVSGDVCFLTTCDTATPTPVATAAGSPPTTSDEPSSPATPSTLSTLPTVADAATASNAIWAAAGTVVLVILIALPSTLLNRTIETVSDRVGDRMRRSRPPRREPGPRAMWLLAAAGVLVASLISAFVDPRFGLDANSPRIFLSVLASFVLDAVVGWFVVILLLRRSTPGLQPRVRFVPATLLLVLGAVLFSRFTGFEPGIVFGLVAGVVLGSSIALAQRARGELVLLGYAFAAAIVGWIGYSVLAGVDGTFATFARETLAAMTVGGIAALPIALVPLRGMPGHTIFSWNRWVWAISYAVGLFGFLFVLLPVPFSWGVVDLSIWAWAGIYAAYAIGAVGVWLVVERPWRRGSGTGGVDGAAEAPVA